ncbi:MAG: DUF4143 domain-containing protein [Propionibacteriaceae bacterium]|jgi:predicted AAA+ superfamily ATPase|nr:DUF4143 domain-containing protein [Propionibacteriaceae bacterium]
MSAYARRVVDDFLDEFQPELAALEIHGAKAVGKTVTASRRARTDLRLDLPADAERLRADPRILATLPGPVLIDEWSRLPESWDLVRRAVDEGALPGRFILTGSATVPKGVQVHSGAGRIVRLRMRPMTIEERGVSAATVSLGACLSGDGTPTGHTDMRLADYVEEIVGSGFPAIRARSGRVRQMLLDSYLEDLVEREFPEQGVVVRKPQVLRAWMAAYAAATGTTASYNRIMEASTPGEGEKPGKAATTTYRDVLAGLWMLDPLLAWSPTHNRLERLAQAPKHFLADPALACRLLRVNAHQLLAGDQGKGGDNLREGTLLGSLFENLATLCVRVAAQAADADVFHMRTYGGDHEIDMIVLTKDGQVMPIEVKLSQSVVDGDVRHIRWLREKLGGDCLDGMVITTGEYAYRRADGVAVVPLGLLGH